MPKSHQQAIQSALTTVDKLGDLFDKLRAGNSKIHMAYKTVFRAIEGNMSDIPALIEALETLTNAVERITATYYGDAIDIGVAQAIRDLDEKPDTLDDDIAAEAITSTMTLLELQTQRSLSVAKLEMGEEYVIGDGGRQGTLRANSIIGEMAFWITSLALVAYEGSVGKQLGTDAKMQAVAQIDSDTTRTCLNVHGQIVELDEKFTLTGTPRYADEMSAPPFHRGCRTGVAIIRSDLIDSKITGDMREEAIEQGNKPKPSTMVGRAHYKVVGKTVQEFRNGRWHKYKSYDSNIIAREEAAKLNRAKRS